MIHHWLLKWRRKCPIWYFNLEAEQFSSHKHTQKENYQNVWNYFAPALKDFKKYGKNDQINIKINKNNQEKNDNLSKRLHQVKMQSKSTETSANLKGNFDLQ